MSDPSWTPEAIQDREAIYNYIERDSPAAALALDELIAMRTRQLGDHPAIGRPGRVAGTRELVIHRHYVVIYEVVGSAIHILRVLHAARQWP